MTWNNNAGRYQAVSDGRLVEVDGDVFAEARNDRKKELMAERGLNEEEATEQAESELINPVQWSGSLPMNGVFIDGVEQG